MLARPGRSPSHWIGASYFPWKPLKGVETFSFLQGFLLLFSLDAKENSSQHLQESLGAAECADPAPRNDF